MSITILVIRPKKGSRKKQAGGAWQRRFLMQIWKFCHSGSTGIIGSLMFSVAPSERTLQEFSKNTWKPKFLHYSPYRWSPVSFLTTIRRRRWVWIAIWHVSERQ